MINYTEEEMDLMTEEALRHEEARTGLAPVATPIHYEKEYKALAEKISHFVEWLTWYKDECNHKLCRKNPYDAYLNGKYVSTLIALSHWHIPEDKAHREKRLND